MQSIILVLLLISAAVAFRYHPISSAVIGSRSWMERLWAGPSQGRKPPAFTEDGDMNGFGKQHDLPGPSIKKVNVMRFEGTVYVNIRKYYTSKESGEVLPTKSGISLTKEQWAALKELIPVIDDELQLERT